MNVSTDHVRPPRGRPTGGGAAMDVYDASKWALDGLTQAWARALRKSNVRVNALCMGATDTPMLRAALPSASAAEIARSLRPEQIARVLIALLREGPDGRSGENIAALVVSWSGGHLGGMSLDLLARSFRGSRVSLTPLARLLGEEAVGPLTGAVMSAYEGLLFGFGVVSGLTRRPR